MRSSSSPTRQNDPFASVAANVTVLVPGRARLEIANSMADALRYTRQESTMRRAARVFGTEGINIRGIGGNRVALLIDGVPLS